MSQIPSAPTVDITINIFHRHSNHANVIHVFRMKTLCKQRIHQCQRKCMEISVEQMPWGGAPVFFISLLGRVMYNALFNRKILYNYFVYQNK